MKIRLAGYINDSIVDGPGLRFTIFAQGCRHKCKGCHNPHTHDYNSGTFYEIDEIVKKIKSNPLLDGITFSGGEPFDQAEAFLKIADKLIDYNIYCYTGYLFEDILNSGETYKLNLLKKIDVLIDGPFEEEKSSFNLRFKGSDNQRILNCKESVKYGRAIEADINFVAIDIDNNTDGLF